MATSDPYPGVLPPLWKATGPPGELIDEDPCIPDVARAFALVRTYGDPLAARDGGLFPGSQYMKKDSGDTRTDIHFQGIQRLRKDPYFVLSGGDRLEHVSQLFLVRLASAQEQPLFQGRAVGSNLVRSKDPASGDLAVKVIALGGTKMDGAASPDYWHAGGLCRLGDLLAVPIEAPATGASRILFLHMADPESPKRFPVEIRRNVQTGKAGAVALVKLPNGLFLCGVSSDSDEETTGLPPRIDFYLSKSKNFLEGFRDKPVTAFLKQMLPSGERISRYQAIKLLLQEDGTLFVVGTENTDPLAPVGFSGDDRMDLLRLDFPDRGLFAEVRPNLKAPPFITRIASKVIRCADKQSNLAAAGGIDVDERGRLTLYAAYHWRVNKEIRLSEYRSDVHEVTRRDHAWIDLFEDVDFKKRRLSILGERDQPVKDYEKIFAERSGFDRKASSVRYQLPTGSTYRLYRNKGCTESAREPSHVDLVGTGRIEEINNFKNMVLEDRAIDFNDMVRSSAYLD